MLTEALLANSEVFPGRVVSVLTTPPGRVQMVDFEDIVSVSNAIGIATNHALEGMPVTFCVFGFMDFEEWNFTPNVPIYVSAYGIPTETVPTKNIIMIGKSITPKKIFVQIADYIMTR